MPEAGTSIAVTGGNPNAQCTALPSFNATVTADNSITGNAISCQGTFAFVGKLASTEVITGNFTSNGWGSPGGTVQATPQTNSGETTFTTATTFVGPITSTGTNLFTGPNTFSSPGAFGNSQANDFVQSLLNSCNPGAEFRQQQGAQNDEPKTTDNTQQSWPIVFVGTTSGGTHPYAKLYEDSTGDLTIANSNIAVQGLNLNTQSSTATLRQMEVLHLGTCTTAASTGSTCTTGAAWAHAFVDTNYVIECTLEDATNTPVIIDTESKTASGFVLRIATISPAASLGTAQCVGFHLN